MLGLRHYRGTAVDLFQGDITSFVCDAMVNAANSSLRGGGGVDGAIHRVGGPSILEECERIGRCETGQAVITTAGRLPAKHVIHTVGPIWRGGKEREAELLQSAYRNSLHLAAESKLLHVAIPSISTGIYGYPVTDAAIVAMESIRLFCDAKPKALRRVTMVLFDSDTYKAYQKALFTTFPEAEGDEP
ncbi:MAG TPA: O-acetyl-ADP-ribose deacetylase [Oligoflexus sp.]|uniref:O-acetyl-ADP-ribose deacetylase n=1 Tax=Oligoflexus sp. TaxID=1971216 RepID=UPI002D80082D|nr:O-acetyl-ADP-ribose deacetylase [Oligoflexus sp.]HET9241447.1 O-acetyl-ADP-ribose deacetylase [Oligoflexus sp.]